MIKHVCFFLVCTLSCLATTRAIGCRLDSGDLSYLSQEVRRMVTAASVTFERPFLASTNIVASNDINEDSLHSLADQVCSWHLSFSGTDNRGYVVVT